MKKKYLIGIIIVLIYSLTTRSQELKNIIGVKKVSNLNYKNGLLASEYTYIFDNNGDTLTVKSKKTVNPTTIVKLSKYVNGKLTSALIEYISEEYPQLNGKFRHFYNQKKDVIKSDKIGINNKVESTDLHKFKYILESSFYEKITEKIDMKDNSVEKTIKKYDDQGNLISINIIKPPFENYSHKFKYDLNNNLIEDLLLREDVDSSTKKYEYDTKNRIIKELWYIGSKLVNYKIFSYNYKNDIVKMELYNENNSFSHYEKFEYKYDINNNLIEKKRLDMSGKVLELTKNEITYF